MNPTNIPKSSSTLGRRALALACLLLTAGLANSQTYNATNADPYGPACISPTDTAGPLLIYLPRLDPAKDGSFTVGGKDGYQYVVKTGATSTFTETATNAHLVTDVVDTLMGGGFGWHVDVTFTGRTDGAPPAGSCNTAPPQWHYYAAFNGTLTGTGGFAGYTLQITGKPNDMLFPQPGLTPTLQVGNGGSGKNPNLGAAGWFFWTVSYTGPNGPNPLNLRSSSQINNGMWFGDFAFNLVIPPTPGLSLVKVANPTLGVKPGDPVTYSYKVTNTGNAPLSNIIINIHDDNGTPNDTSDDFDTQQAVAFLAPGAMQTITATRPFASSGNLCADIDGDSVVVSTLKTTMLAPGAVLNGVTFPNGGIKIVFTQDPGINDNRYGTGANAATGWSGGHKFGDLVGSDQAVFSLTAANGTEILNFDVDYISAATSATFPAGTVNYPSGYGSLGVNGGEGNVNKGSASSVLYATTSLTENLRIYPSGFLVNSPAETAPLSGMSTVAPQWDYKNSYTVVVDKNAFTAGGGFGGVQILSQHNSPAKRKPSTPPEPCQDCITNTAVATATANGITVATSNPATASVNCLPPGGGCPVKFYKDNQNKIAAPNNKDTVLSSVFTSSTKATCSGFGDDGNKKFHDALGWGNGDPNKIRDAFKALLREAVAALSNASNPTISYGFTRQEVIDMVNDALQTCNAANITNLRESLMDLNNRGSAACQTSSTGNCTTNGKPNQLKLTYYGGNCGTAQNSQPVGTKYNCNDVVPNGPNGASPVRVVVSSSSTTPTTTSQRFFDGPVNLNQQFVVNGSFGANTYVFIYNGNTLVETVQIHTSCSAPLVRTETFGALRLDDYAIVANPEPAPIVERIR